MKDVLIFSFSEALAVINYFIPSDNHKQRDTKYQLTDEGSFM